MILEANAELLEQAARLIQSIDDATYVRPAALFEGQRIGGHIRHVIEFYEGLFRGLQDGRVDYDARCRDAAIESKREAAISRLQTIAVLLRTDSRLRANRMMWVAGEGAAYAESSIAREFQAICSHTVHHFALIAVLMRYYGLPVPSDFGVSQATLRYRAAQAA
jgi:uncharacterized damage-inducible protein DinB